MTRQEEVQEQIAIFLYGVSNNPFTCLGWVKAPEVQRQQCRKNAYLLMIRLEDMGVVIKVDKDLGEIFGVPAFVGYYRRGTIGYEMLLHRLSNEGYVAVEPLVK